MIHSRNTYANIKHLVDELINTSLYRSGTPVRPNSGFYEEGGPFSSSPTASPLAAARANSYQKLVQLLPETRDAICALSSRQYIEWD
jgi:hypothetical protein